jgi:MFS transporter, DHA3 family, macrolide efflux protein
MKKIYRDKNFMLIMSGKFISLLGNAVFEMGLMWYILSEYGKESGGMLAWIMVVGILPTVILGGFLGAIADRYNKKTVIVTSDFLSGGIVLGLTAIMYLGVADAFTLLVVTMVLSLSSSLVGISVSSMIPELFSKDNLYEANSANQFTERVTALLGLSCGGVLVGLLGVESVFLITGIAYIISAVSEMFIKYSLRGMNMDLKEENSSFIKDFKDILEFIRNNKSLLRLVLVFTLVNFLWDPLLNIVAPYVMKNNFNITSSQFGLMQAALPFGFCIGAIYFTKYKGFIESKHVVFNSIFAVNIALLLFTLPIVFQSASNGFGFITYYFIFMKVLMGIFSAAINISTSVKIQLSVPDNLRGKFLGFSRSLSMGMMPIGSAVIGMILGKVNSSLFFIGSVTLVFIIILVVPKSSYAIKYINIAKSSI